MRVALHDRCDFVDYGLGAQRLKLAEGHRSALEAIGGIGADSATRRILQEEKKESNGEPDDTGECEEDACLEP